MKTRIMTNKDRNSYRVDVIDKEGLTSHYFPTEKEAKEFQSNRIKFRSAYINKKHLALYKQI